MNGVDSMDPDLVGSAEQLLESVEPGSPWTPIFEQARLGVALLTRDFRYCRVNHTFAAAEGQSADFFTGRNHFELYPQPATEEIFRRVVASGETYAHSARPFEAGINPRRGIGCWDWSLSAVGGDDGAAMLVLVMQDVTARIRAEERARRAEADTRSLLGRIPGMIFRARRHWSCELMLNSETLSGYSATEIERLPKKWLSVVHPDDLAAVVAAAESLDAGLAQTTMVYRIVTRDGAIRWVEDRRSRLLGADGACVGVEGVVFDVTEGHEREHLQREHDAQHATLIDTALDGYWQLDSAGRIVEVNDAYCRMSGYRRDELLQMRSADVEAGDDGATLARIGTQGGDRYATLHRRRDGSLHKVEINARWSPQGGGRIFAFIRDLDAGRRTEALLQTRLRLSELAPVTDVDALLQVALDSAESLTGSSIGFFHFVAADEQSLTLNAWSTNTLRHMCRPEGKGRHYPVAQAGVWVDCIRQRQPVIHNDYATTAGRKGLPPGHTPVVRELTVPVLHDDRIVAVIGVGNKPSDYLPEDVDCVAQLATLAMDVVARKRAEIAQHASDTRYRQLFESLTSGFALHEIVVDAAGQPVDYRFLDVNSAFAAITGMAASELIGRTVREVLPNTEAIWIERYGDVALSGDPALFEAFSGELRRWYRLTAYSPERGQFAVIVDDVTRAHQDDEKLRQAAAVFEHTRDGVVITDVEARIVAVNRAYTEITGYAANEVIGRNPRVLQSSCHDSEFYAAMWSELAASDFWQGEVWDRRRDGEAFPIWLTLTAVRNEAGAVERYIGVFTDISRIKAAEARADYAAYHDTLTGLPNRTLLNLRFQHAIDRAQRRDRRLALLLLDLDLFKNVNDTLGHDVGDRLLVAIAERFKARLRAEDTLARLGGDEFAVLIDELDDAADAALLAGALLEELARPFDLGTANEIYIGASIGISVSPDDGTDSTLLLRNADAAVYLAKSQGRGTFRFYTGALTASALERMTLESRLRKAIEQDCLVLHYQPLIEASCGRVIGAEALVRWHDADEGLIAPGRFIPVAEDSGLIAPLGAWVLHQACAQMQAWLAAGRSLRTIAVNISPRQFFLQDVPTLVAEALAATGLAARYLELEITESSLMEQGEGALSMLSRIRELGVRLSIDDFGTGYSSLSYLKRFPIDKLKIDQSFVRDISTDANDAAIASTIIAMARSLKLSVLAEGVETQEQLDFLEHRGCDFYQGYFFGRPVPAEDFPEAVR